MHDFYTPKAHAERGYNDERYVINDRWAFLFENIYEILEFYPDYIRQVLMCRKEGKLKGQARAQDGDPRSQKRRAAQ